MVTEWDQLPPLGSKPPHLTPNIPGGISEGLRTGHRPGTDPLPVGQCLDPSQTGPRTHHASADSTPGSGVDSTHWSLLHSPAGGDEFARLILKAHTHGGWAGVGASVVWFLSFFFLARLTARGATRRVTRATDSPAARADAAAQMAKSSPNTLIEISFFALWRLCASWWPGGCERALRCS